MPNLIRAHQDRPTIMCSTTRLSSLLMSSNRSQTISATGEPFLQQETIISPSFLHGFWCVPCMSSMHFRASISDGSHDVSSFGPPFGFLIGICCSDEVSDWLGLSGCVSYTRCTSAVSVGEWTDYSFGSSRIAS